MTDLDTLVQRLKAAGEPTRLRMLALLAEGDLTVKDFTLILEQSQPRISRHLKILTDADLINRSPEGSWVYYKLAEDDQARELVTLLNEQLNPEDPVLDGDLAALRAIWNVHLERATRYFSRNATSWDRIRSLHVSDEQVEQAMLNAVHGRHFQSLLDLGTGTGRILQLFSGQIDKGVGVDMSHSMLEVARANLARDAVTNTEVLHGSILDLARFEESSDLVTIHQVLHFLDEPHRAIEEAARALLPGGVLVLVDFAPHHLEFLRDDHAHRRLGFDTEHVRRWIEDAGLVMTSDAELHRQDEGEDALTVCLWVASKPERPQGVLSLA
ncbi:ArsR/SmtB family transcription factor [Coralliovum pocilloporae]|uniref:ArsR/SmtB family transcription factor n=1 Tax=Coralliovum pocilloporae TaxID=3066369 RepID=UPI0033075B82